MERPPLIAVRPLTPDDAGAFQSFVRALSPESRYQRFLVGVRELAPGLLRMLTQAPDGRQQGLVAVQGTTIIGEVRYALESAGTGEFALAVANAWQRRGIGSRLLQVLARRARSAGLERLVGEVSAGNGGMLALARKAGFGIRMHPGDARIARIAIDLRAAGLQ